MRLFTELLMPYLSDNIDIDAIYEIDNQTRMEAKKVVKSLS